MENPQKPPSTHYRTGFSTTGSLLLVAIIGPKRCLNNRLGAQLLVAWGAFQIRGEFSRGLWESHNSSGPDSPTRVVVIIGKREARWKEVGLHRQMCFDMLCCSGQVFQKRVSNMLGNDNQWTYTRGRSGPVRVYIVFNYSGRVR